MRRRIFAMFACLIWLGLLAGTGLGAIFEDPLNLYNIVIPEQWVYQGSQSSNEFVVFYGPDEDGLLYLEYLNVLPDGDVWEFAQRSLELYEAPGGLKDFRLEQPLKLLEVDGIEGVHCIYSYEAKPDERLWEQRIFLLLDSQSGFSITLGGGSDLASELHPIVKETLSHWRWLF